MGFQEQAALLKEEMEAAATSPLSRSCQAIAVTKYVDAATTRQLVEETSLTHLGENRVPAFLAKKAQLADLPLTWHFIGSLQRRKVKDVINEVDYFHALDSIRLGEEIQKRAQHPIACFLQVNLAREASKHGFLQEEIEGALQAFTAMDKIELVGLMTMAPAGASTEELQDLFRETEELRQALAAKRLEHMPFTELSMGMSSDYKEAIQNGATFIRIGSLLFE